MVFSSAKGVGPWRRASLDHVVSAHEIHEDPVRILSDIDPVSLANDPENLRFTCMSLNSKMGDISITEFLDWCDKNPDRQTANTRLGKWRMTQLSGISCLISEKFLETPNKSRHRPALVNPLEYYLKKST